MVAGGPESPWTTQFQPPTVRKEIAPGLYLGKGRGGPHCEVCCLHQAWFEILVLYHPGDLSLSFLIRVMKQHMKFVMKIKKDNVSDARLAHSRCSINAPFPWSPQISLKV